MIAVMKMIPVIRYPAQKICCMPLRYIFLRRLPCQAHYLLAGLIVLGVPAKGWRLRPCKAHTALCCSPAFNMIFFVALRYTSLFFSVCFFKAGLKHRSGGGLHARTRRLLSLSKYPLFLPPPDPIRRSTPCVPLYHASK